MTVPSVRPTGPALARRLGLFDAVIVGAGSMIGAGVFSAWGPAADAAGAGLLVGLVIAAVVAFCNATSSAQLAAVHPESGGTYVFARRQLSPAWGHLAGWSFVVGKTASCVALALTAGEYLWPEHARPVAILAVAVVAVVNIGGLSRTVGVTKCLLVVAISALAAVIIAGWSTSTTSLSRITPIDTTLAGALRAAGFLFFAFAGYARIATLGEEVRDPANTIPRAIPRALGAVLVIYAAVGVTLLATVPVEAIAASDAPLDLVVRASRFDLLSPIVRIGAGIAALGVLLNLIPGISRTVLAMARRHELPHWFAAVDEHRSIPLRAEAAITVIVIALTATVDLRGAIGFSGVTILTYYAITNAASLTLQPHQRRWPRSIAIVGIAGCLTLAVALPIAAIATGTVVLIVGAIAGRLTPSSNRPGRRPPRPREWRVRGRG